MFYGFFADPLAGPVATLARLIGGHGAKPSPVPPAGARCGAIRPRLGLSQNEFAWRFRLPLPSLRKWEQGRRRPDAAARAYLLLIERDPRRVAEMLGTARPADVGSSPGIADLIAALARDEPKPWRGRQPRARR